MLFGVPTTFIQLLNAGLPGRHLPATRYCFSAAAPLPKEIARAWEERFGHTSGRATASPRPRPSPATTTSAATSWAPSASDRGLEMKIVGEDGGEVRAGAGARSCIRGPNVMLGYWNRPEDTAKAIRRRLVPLRRHRRARRRRLLRDLRSAQGHDHHLRLQRLSGRGRERALRPPGGGRGRGLGRARPGPRRAGGRHDRGCARRSACSDEELIEFCRARIAGYKSPRRVELVQRDSEEPDRQDPQARAERTGELTP